MLIIYLFSSSDFSSSIDLTEDNLKEILKETTVSTTVQKMNGSSTTISFSFS